MNCYYIPVEREKSLEETYFQKWEKRKEEYITCLLLSIHIWFKNRRLMLPDGKTRDFIIFRIIGTDVFNSNGENLWNVLLILTCNRFITETVTIILNWYLDGIMPKPISDYTQTKNLFVGSLRNFSIYLQLYLPRAISRKPQGHEVWKELQIQKCSLLLHISLPI